MACEKCLIRNMPKCYEAANDTTAIFIDVAHALMLVKSHQLTPIPLSFSVMQAFQGINDVDPEHLEHVNLEDPILIAAVPWDRNTPAAVAVGDENIPAEEFTADNSVMLMMIDGSHRAARALRDGVAIKTYYLPIQLTKKCFLGMEDKRTNTIYADATGMMRNGLLIVLLMLAALCPMRADEAESVKLAPAKTVHKFFTKSFNAEMAAEGVMIGLDGYSSLWVKNRSQVYIEHNPLARPFMNSSIGVVGYFGGSYGLTLLGNRMLINHPRYRHGLNGLMLLAETYCVGRNFAQKRTNGLRSMPPL